MKEKEPFPPHTVALLQEDLPGTEARPGFETRLLANLADPPPRPSPFFRLALASLGLLVLLAALIVTQLPAPPKSGSVVDNPALSIPPLEVSPFSNPLETEAQAMRSTANRAGLFLLSHLPTLPEGEETL
jgi:hypothetical protein